MPPLVTAVVVNWNGRAYLAECLASLLAQDYPHFEVILVDNGSTDGSPDLAQASFPQVQVVRNERNLGFAAACNQGIRMGRGEYLATLNNDLLLERAWLGEMVKTLEGDALAGMGACKMLLWGSPGVVDSRGFAPDLAGFAWNRGAGEPDRREADGPQEVFGACAGAALYRRRMLEEIAFREGGGEAQYFDEDFFLYLEDVDLAWRGRLAGWKCLYVPTARAHHWHSASLGEASPRKRYFLARNRLWVMAKGYPWELVLLFWPLMALYDLAASAYQAARFRTLMPLAGRLAGGAGLPRILARRRLAQGKRKVGLGELWPLMGGLPSPWGMLSRDRTWSRLRGR